VSVTVTVLPAIGRSPSRLAWKCSVGEPIERRFYAPAYRSSKVSASQRSASIAAAAPVPAEVMACR
jgi:hypothetical protein